MTVRIARPEHEVLFQDMVDLLRRHADQMSSEEMLAVGANMIGKLIALQDQRTMTRERALKILIANIEAGNEQVVEQLTKSEGSA